ncbi:flagellin [Modestobacter marinus]|uniref:Flagellin n=1 Tax=Modestobacter marinus TaxID=477641 RepID=A0A846LCJ7_9ACTN|nr:flagellin [Modestobacter marinus]NIH65843.1 flagellin [Modestobacter marinus]GGL67548.1 flagellin [Modestobacter marinus]
MGLSVNNNIAAMNSYRNLSITDNQMGKSLEKLSSGFRINRAADDAAGLAISEGLRSQIGGLKVAVRNTQDGISVVQTAEGALTETHSLLQRMRDLAVQASNDGGLNAAAKTNIQAEVTQLQSELTRIADTTKFNGNKLLDGSFNANFQVGANAGETIGVAVTQGMSAAQLGVATVDVSTGGPEWASAPGSLSFTGTAPTLTVDVNGTGARTLDLAGWSAGTTAADAAANQALIQKAYDTELNGSGFTVKVDSYGGVKANGPTGSVAADLVLGGGTIATTFNATAASGASAAISAIDTAIGLVSTTRANLGALQNRFEHTINNLNVAVENLSASESRIRDTDMAQEMTNFTRTQILTQAGTAMLAQANQAPQGILKLLG